ncbi:hypothetical protein DIPPA_22891 [Diplonema papillatum]|nr:hypothetical protein DIPPA_22891 [Diplonema papillatum]
MTDPDKGQPNALRRWEAQVKQWEGLSAKLAARVAKPETALLHNTVHHWREKVEELDYLHASIPDAAKNSVSGWEMSLRDQGDGCRYVKFGSSFPYPLYCPVWNRDYLSADSATFMHVVTQNTATAPRRPRLGETSDYFKSRESQYRRHIVKKFPHRQHEEDGTLLCVIGEQPPVTSLPNEEDIVAPVQHYEFVAAEESSVDQQPVLSAGEGACSKRWDTGESAAPAAAEQGAGTPTSQPRQGPLLHLASDRLCFQTAPNQLAHVPLKAANLGTTAIFYCWRQLPPDPITSSAGVEAPRAPKCSTFILPESHSGVLLPGQEHSFPFSFRSSRPCMSTEAWELQTVPAGQQQILVNLRGVTTAQERDPLSVGFLASTFEQKATEDMAANVVLGLLNKGTAENVFDKSDREADVRNRKTDEQVHREAKEKEEQNRRAFDRANEGLGFHHATVLHRDVDLFWASVRVAVDLTVEEDDDAAAAAAPPLNVLLKEEAHSRRESKVSGGAEHPPNADEAPAAWENPAKPPQLPDAWDGAMSSLYEAVNRIQHAGVKEEYLRVYSDICAALSTDHTATADAGTIITDRAGDRSVYYRYSACRQALSSFIDDIPDISLASRAHVSADRPQPRGGAAPAAGKAKGGAPAAAAAAAKKGAKDPAKHDDGADEGPRTEEEVQQQYLAHFAQTVKDRVADAFGQSEFLYEDAMARLHSEQKSRGERVDPGQDEGPRTEEEVQQQYLAHFAQTVKDRVADAFGQSEFLYEDRLHSVLDEPEAFVRKTLAQAAVQPPGVDPAKHDDGADEGPRTEEEVQQQYLAHFAQTVKDRVADAFGQSEFLYEDATARLHSVLDEPEAFVRKTLA